MNKKSRHAERAYYYKEKRMKRLFVTLALMMGLAVSVGHGFYGDIATDKESFTLGIAGQNANQITSLTALFPLEDANGWAGAYVSRQVADGEVVAETLNAHLQGGFNVRGIGIEAYASATRDKFRMIDLAIETGYFLRPGTFTWNDITFSGGAGNYTERRTEDSEIGRDAGDASVTFGWLAFLSAKWRNVSGVVRFKPSIDFKETRIESSASVNYPVSNELGIGFTTQAVVEAEDVHTSYLLQVTYSPE